VFRTLAIEALESRSLLSAIPPLPLGWHAAPTSRVHWIANPTAGGSSSPSGLSPSQVRGSYGLGIYNGGALSGGVTFKNGVAGDGTGQTIAIVDAYDDPNAASDLNAFSTYYGLPTFGGGGGPTFTKLNQTGGAALPSTDPSSPWSGSGSTTWEMEESLDIEWAHVMAPMANIILFEASDASTGLYTAAQTAAGTAGVVAVSMSWGGSEFSVEMTYDSGYFFTPSGHLGGSATMSGTKLPGGITFLASTGDRGAYSSGGTTLAIEYPAASPNVIAVGGTSLFPNGNTYGYESSWGNGTSSGSSGGTGGGISSYESQPTYQSGIVSAFSTTKRTTPDVSADANPNTGVPIYDTWDFGASTPWLAGYIGGTSLSSPLWAGMVTVADQGRAIMGLGSLDGYNQTLPALYKLSASDFHDITSGSSIGPASYGPGTGFDLSTGIGSPVANLLLPQLVGPTQLAFGQQPTSTGVNAAIAPAITVLVEDSLGNVVATDSSSVTVAIGTNTAGGTLSGTKTVTAVNGVATFSGLSINQFGTGYTLVASDTTGTGTLTSTSAAFNVSPPPSVASPAAATPNPISGNSTNLSVLGADSGGELTLTYTWAATTLPAGAPAVTFSAGGTNAAKNCTATFGKAGNYVLTATITNVAGASTISSVSVTVSQTATSVTVTPAMIPVNAGGTQQFTATALDQFGGALVNQPAFNWSTTSGSITATGVFTSAGAPATVTATSGGLSDTAQATVNQPPTVAALAAASPGTVTGTTTSLSVLGADDGGESNLTYTWAATTLPAGAVQPSFSVNGTNGAKNTTATFSKTGAYVFTVTIADAGGLTAVSSVSVTVSATVTSINLSPSTSTLATTSQQQYAATAVDQFGNAISPTPALNWTATSGSVSSTGLYNASANPGAVMVTAAGGTANASASDTLAAPSTQWRFDDGTGTTATDSSGNGDTGAVNGATWTTGIYNSGLSFNGSSNSVTSSSAALNGSGDFTIGAWIKTTATAAGVIIQQRGSSNNGQYQLAITASGTVNFWMRSSSSKYQFNITTTATINDGKWHYVSGVRQGVTGYIYIDTAVAASGSSSSTLRSLTTNGVSVGADTVAGNMYFNGAIDEVRIYTAAISSNGMTSLATTAPTITTPAAASPSAVTGTTTVLSVLGGDDGGEGNLKYTWTTTGTPPAAVGFSANGTNAAKTTTVTFAAAGTYNFLATAVDAFGLVATSSVSVVVNATLTTITVSPTTTSLNAGGTQQFTAIGKDQFGSVLVSQPSYAWTATAGTINSSGFYTAPNGSANVTLTAAASGVAGTASITVNGTNQPPTVATSAAASPGTVTATTTSLSVLGADDGGEGNLTYTWTVTGTPPAAVSFLPNNTNAAKNSTATFAAAGSYSFIVTITDAGGLTATSTVSVVVNASLTTIAVSPATVGLNAGGAQQFAATALDQFSNVLASQPIFSWSTTVGTISSSGYYTAPNVSTTSTVTASAGGLSGHSLVTVTNHMPTVAASAAASPGTVAGTTTLLSVLGADDAGEGNLTYTWAVAGTPPAAVTFFPNGANAAKNSTATFAAAGNYSFTVTIIDAGGLTATSNVIVVVNATPTGISVSPVTVNLNAGGAQQFAATVFDQFGNVLAIQPSFSWSTTVGAINSGGFYTAPNVSASGTVTASAGGLSGHSSVTVTNQSPTIATPAAASPGTVTGTTTSLSVLAADDAGEANLTYTWATTGTPPAAVSFSANSTNAANNTTATFAAPGNYNLIVTVTDAGGLTATSNVSVAVNTTLTTIAVSPATVGLNAGGAQQFAATALDQFGNALASQPMFSWSTTVGAITSSGYYSAPNVSATSTVTASVAGVSGNALLTVNDQPPTVATPAAASPATVTGTTTSLSVLGADDAGQANLRYTWATMGTPPAAVSFSANGTNAAKYTTATFAAAGNYSFTVTITDAGGLTATSNVSVMVTATLTTVAVLPAAVGLNAGGTQQFIATANDQFGNSLATQPVFAWTATSGIIDSSGFYTAPNVSAVGTITAAAGGVSGNALVTVTNQQPTVASPATASPGAVAGTTTLLSVLGTDDAGEGNLTYSWTVAGTPPAVVTFSPNGTNAAKNTTATFAAAGNYNLIVTITDAGGLTTTSNVSVMVNATLTTVTVSPGTISLNAGGTQQFTATAKDQFGNLLASQPALAWTATSGIIDGSGFYTAPNISGTSTVTASAAGVSGIALVTVNNQAPTVAAPATASPVTVTGTTTSLSAIGADDAGEANLTYTWATTGTPPAAVSFSANGTNAAKNSTATFAEAGSYNFIVTITDAGGLTATSTVNVVVNQTLTGMQIALVSSNLATDGTAQYAATGLDQFGAMMINPPLVTWGVLGSGSIDSSGRYSPPYAAGSATIEATTDHVGATLTVDFPGPARWSDPLKSSWNTSAAWADAGSTTELASPGLRGVTGDAVVLAPTSGGTLSLDGSSPHVASITLDASHGGAALAGGSGGTLYLDNGSQSAPIIVVGGSGTISAPIVAASNLVVSAAKGSVANITGGIAGGGISLTVEGAGTVILASTDSLTGGTNVVAGTLQITDASQLADGSGLSVGNATALFFAAPAAFPAPTKSAATAGAVPTAGSTKSASVPSAVRTLVIPAVAPVSACHAVASGQVFRTGWRASRAVAADGLWAATLLQNQLSANKKVDVATALADALLRQARR
jgi:hypothetical protein